MIAVDKLCTPLKISHTLKDLPNTCQWASVLKVSCKDSDEGRATMGLQLPEAALFTGPPGNGRHITAYALAGSLCSKVQRYTGCYQIHGYDLNQADKKNLSELMDYIRKLAEAGPLILLLDHPELSEHSQDLQLRLLRCQWELKQHGSGLFLMVISADAEHLIPELLSSCPLYHCPPPSESRVQQWVVEILHKPVIIKIADLKSNEIAHSLAGLSWRQLTDFHNHLMRLLLLKYALNHQKFKGVSEKSVLSNGQIILERNDVTPILESLEALKPRTVTTPMMVSSPVPASSVEPEHKITDTDTDDETTEITTMHYSEEHLDKLFDI